jgi:hypothetical protein
MLGELALRSADHVGVAIENDRPRAGGALIESDDVILVLGIGHVMNLAQRK